MLDTKSVNYRETTQYMEENMKEVFERKKLKVEEVFYFAVFG